MNQPRVHVHLLPPEPRSPAWYTEWSKSERGKGTWYINAYIWNLERWYGWTYLQGRNRDAENRLVGTVGEGEGGRIERVALKQTSHTRNRQWEFAGDRRELSPGALRQLCFFNLCALLAPWVTGSIRLRNVHLHGPEKAECQRQGVWPSAFWMNPKSCFSPTRLASCLPLGLGLSIDSYHGECSEEWWLTSEQVPGPWAQASLQEGRQVLPGAGTGSQQNLGVPCGTRSSPRRLRGAVHSVLVFGGPCRQNCSAEKVNTSCHIQQLGQISVLLLTSCVNPGRVTYLLWAQLLICKMEKIKVSV